LRRIYVSEEIFASIFRVKAIQERNQRELYENGLLACNVSYFRGSQTLVGRGGTFHLHIQE
jgi:hypothetical protein